MFSILSNVPLLQVQTAVQVKLMIVNVGNVLT